MNRVNINKLLERAEGQFSIGDYMGALVIYGVLLDEFPESSEAKIGAFLCDIGMDNPQEAQALFDYYQIVKYEKDDANEIMINLITSLDSAKE
ncbi:MAG: tetratricopeptide repeat protein, partial [Epsilonproteobacteria bacterium]|nr:tetratricopeptide repeat protein [Campylobacterota bacterium]